MTNSPYIASKRMVAFDKVLLQSSINKRIFDSDD